MPYNIGCTAWKALQLVLVQTLQLHCIIIIVLILLIEFYCYHSCHYCFDLSISVMMLLLIFLLFFILHINIFDITVLDTEPSAHGSSVREAF